MRSHVTANLLAALLVSFMVTLFAGQMRAEVAHSLDWLNGANGTVPVHPAEDDPSWNCQDHGNHVCGEVGR